MSGTAFFDLDKTITFEGTWTRFIRFAAKDPPKLNVKLMRLGWQAAKYKAGFANRGSVKQRAIELYLKGRTKDDLQARALSFAREEMTSGIRPGALRAIEWHRKEGHRLIIASAAADLIVGPLAGALGFDDIICTQLSWSAEDRLLPELRSENCYGEEKLRRIEAWCGDQKETGKTWMYSDHVSDLPALLWADHGIAINPSPALRRRAPELGLAIDNWAT